MAKKNKKFYFLHCEKCNFPTTSVQMGTKAEDRKKLDGLSRYCKMCRAHTSQVQKSIPKPQ